MISTGCDNVVNLSQVFDTATDKIVNYLLQNGDSASEVIERMFPNKSPEFKLKLIDGVREKMLS